MKIKDLSNFDIKVLDANDKVVFQGSKSLVDESYLECDIKQVDMEKNYIEIWI